MEHRDEAAAALLLRRVRKAAMLVLALGIVALAAATWAVIVAPEGAVVEGAGRTGYRRVERGLWVLYMSPACLLMFAWLGLQPHRFGLEKTPPRFMKIWLAMTLVIAIMAPLALWGSIGKALG